LVGHSFGSFVIHQMAQQLVLRNKAPASLLVIDTPMPNSAVLELQDRQIAALLIANLSEFFQLNLTDDEQQLYCTLADELQTKWLSKHLAAAGYQFSARQLLTLQCVYKAQLQAKVEIKGELLEVPLMVIKAHDTKEFAGQLLADDMGWRVVNPELSAIEITGNHLSILQHQFVAAIVEQIASKYTLY
jgi:thioesterase domain-containing protein